MWFLYVNGQFLGKSDNGFLLLKLCEELMKLKEVKSITLRPELEF